MDPENFLVVLSELRPDQIDTLLSISRQSGKPLAELLETALDQFLNRE